MSEPPIGPAYRITTPRLVVRCWDPRDALSLKTAIDASLGELAPWLAWARDEPQSLAVKIELLRQSRGKFDLGQDYLYGVFDRDEREVVGGCGLHTRAGPDAREIGYWIATAHSGSGFATEVAMALVRVGFEVDRVERVEIHCDADNARSAMVAKKLGFRHDGTLRQRLRRSDGTLADRMIWSMFAAEYAESPCLRSRIEAFDVYGDRLIGLPAGADVRRRSAFR